MKQLMLILLIFSTVNLQALTVYDSSRHVTDIIDNIQDLIDQVSQIKNQVEQIKKINEQIKQMDDYLERLGEASKVLVPTEELGTEDILEILKEIEEYIQGGGITEEEKDENEELFGEIDKEQHKKLEDPLPIQKYAKHERVEKEFAAYKKTSDSISQKRLGILTELESLSSRLRSAQTDQEIQKVNASVNAHKLILAALKDEEDRQFNSFQAEVRRNENARAKERTRYEERSKLHDHLNRHRPKSYKITKSADILKLIEAK